MFLAMKDLKYNKSRYFLVVAILILLTFMVLFLSGIANGLSLATSASIKKSAADYYVLSEDADSIITRSTITIEQLEEIKAQTGSDVTPINLIRMNIYKEDAQKKLDITYMAVDKNSFMMPANTDADQMNDKENSIYLNKSFEDEGIAKGDIITDASSGIQMKVIGFVKNEMYGHSAVGVITLDTMTKLRTAMNENYVTTYHAIAIRGEDANSISLEGTEVLSKSEVIKSIPGHSQEQMSINMILWVLILVSAVVLGVFFYILTMQKTSEFGVMKAIGMEMKMLFKMILSQVLILAGGSMLISNILTFLMASILPANMPFSLEVTSAVMLSVVFVLISLAFSIFSLRKVAKIDPLMMIGGHE